MANNDNIIRAGDLVMVVKPSPCCASTKYISKIFKVASIEQPVYGAACCDCLTVIRPKKMAVDENDLLYDFSELKKINPPPVEESLDTTLHLEIESLV